MFDRTGPGSPQIISVADAVRVLDTAPVTPRVQRAPLRDALGLRLAEPIASDRDHPPFDKALMDGFAVQSADVTRPGAALQVIDTVPAGRMGHRAIGAGEAAAIMTGAPSPPAPMRSCRSRRPAATAIASSFTNPPDPAPQSRAVAMT